MSGDRLRELASTALEGVLASRAPATERLEVAGRDLAARDRKLLVELVLGSLRWLRRIDHVLESASSRSIERIDRPLLAPMRLGIYQLLFLDRVPAHAAVSEAVDDARRRTQNRGAGFVNAVLRRVARSAGLSDWPVKVADPIARLGIETSHPDFLVRKWMRQFGEEPTRRLLKANNTPKPVHLLTFPDRGGRESVLRRLSKEGIETTYSRLSPLGLIVRTGNALHSTPFREGDLYVQDEASQAAAVIPAPVAGERIFDAAASPGGKSFAMLAAEPAVRLVSGDLRLHRLERLLLNTIRMRRAIPIVASAAEMPGLGAAFDRVVVDLPCSGTGTLRKHPELKWRVGPAELQRLSRQAATLLDGVAPLVAPGGLLIAITCSIEPEENEATIDDLLGRTPDLALEPLDSLDESPLAPYVEWRP